MSHRQSSQFFTVGGALRSDAPSYIKRPADDELFDRVLSGEFCYILTPRQLGKSSLMVRTARRLQEQGIKTAVVDLTQIGSAEIKAEQWYLGLLTELQRKLKLSVEPETWWLAHASLGRVQRFTDFLRNVILQEINDQIVIFIDEIDATLQLDFTDDFFAAIRAMYNARANDPEFKRLTFVLLGVATPSDLIKDRTRTPLNIGYDIDLQEFSRADAAVLQAGLEAVYPDQGATILKRIFHWTSGHPYLTQKLCRLTVETENETWDEEQIDALVRKLFLSQEAQRETNLQFVRNGVQTSPNRRRLLKLYRQVYEGKTVTDDKRTLDKNRLKLLGLVKSEHGILRVRNKIYKNVFDLDWIKDNTPRDWPRYIAIALVAIVMLLVGIFCYLTYISSEQVDASQAETFIDNFLHTTSPDIRVTNLSNLFRIPGFEDRSRKLFFNEIAFEEQVALLGKANTQVLGNRLIIIVKGLYTHIDDNPTANQLLQVMARTLRKVESDEATNLATEIDQWLKGREFAARKDFAFALSAYDTAIDLNPDNIGTRFDRALVYTELDQYDKALADFDAALAIVNRAPPTPTPTRTSTPRYTAIPIETPIALSPETTPTSTPEITPTPTPATTASTSILPVQRFTSSKQIIARIEAIISQSNPLRYALLIGKSRYPNLFQTIQVTAVDVTTVTPTVLTTTPTPTYTPTLISETVSAATPTSTPTPISEVVSATPPTLPSTSTPVKTTFTPTHTPTSTPTPTYTPAPMPITGIVTIENLNVRWGPGTDYGYVGAVYKGDEVIILGRNPSQNWLKVVTPDKRIGWASAKYIETLADIGSLPIVLAPPPPSIPVALVIQGSLDFNREIDIEGRSIPGKLSSYEEHWYTFEESDPVTVVIFMFKPNINFYGDGFIGYNVEFFLHDENQIPVWPPGDADSLVSINIGAGTYPGRDRDGDLSTGELVWRGGPLVPGTRYYLRFVNRSSEPIEYCIAPGDVFHWSCR